jgi:putative hemolysin
VALAEPLTPVFAFAGEAAGPVSIITVTLVLTFLTLVFGEVAPKRVALQHAERWALIAARPLAFLATASKPVIWLLSKATDVAVRLMGGDPGRHRQEITPGEIRDLVTTHGGFTPEQRLIISGAVEITERNSAKCLCPDGLCSPSTPTSPSTPRGPTWPPPLTRGRRSCAMATWTTPSAWSTSGTCC